QYFKHRGNRARALYALHLFLPGGRHDPAGGDDRRHRAHAASPAARSPSGHRCPGGPYACGFDRDRQGAAGAGAGEQYMTIGLGHYLSVAAMLFTLGIFGIFLNRKNVIIILMSIELILLAVNINLVAFSTHLGDIVGQVYALLVLTVAAAEAAIGLAILVVLFVNLG